jgi:hypothetical protein
MFTHTREGSSMADEWYYWHDTEVLGPFSGRLLAGLAAAGKLLPTDTVWKEGIERGVPASSVKHLFPETPANSAPPTEAPSSPVVTADASAIAGETPLPWFSGASPQPQTRTARAVAGKGAVIVGQDGTTVKYRKKCTMCGHEDSSWRAISITRGTTRVSYFCPKCRRTCAVEIHGYVS